MSFFQVAHSFEYGSSFLGRGAYNEAQLKESERVKRRAMSQRCYESDVAIVCSQLREDFETVGDPESPGWRDRVRTGFATSYRPDVVFPEIRTEVATGWTPDNVYFAFWCPYLELNLFEGEDPGKLKWGLWDRDVAEVFINPFPDRVHRYFEFEVAPNNLWVDLAIDVDRDPIWLPGWKSGFQHGTKIESDPKRWFCDLRIPAASLGVPRIESGMEWRVNLYRCDGPGDDSQRRFLAWSPTLDPNFHVPERFGRLLIRPAGSL